MRFVLETVVAVSEAGCGENTGQAHDSVPVNKNSLSGMWRGWWRGCFFFSATSCAVAARVRIGLLSRRGRRA